MSRMRSNQLSYSPKISINASELVFPVFSIILQPLPESQHWRGLQAFSL